MTLCVISLLYSQEFWLLSWRCFSVKHWCGVSFDVSFYGHNTNTHTQIALLWRNFQTSTIVNRNAIWSIGGYLTGEYKKYSIPTISKKCLSWLISRVSPSLLTSKKLNWWNKTSCNWKIEKLLMHIHFLDVVMETAVGNIPQFKSPLPLCCSHLDYRHHQAAALFAGTSASVWW